MELGKELLLENGPVSHTPKNPSAWRIETMLDDTSLIFVVFFEPLALDKPKCLGKYGLLTTPPLVVRLN